MALLLHRSSRIYPHRNSERRFCAELTCQRWYSCPVKSTTSIPSAPGFYWFSGVLGQRGDKAANWEVVRVQASPVSEEIPATVYVTGRNSKYGLHSCKGRWAGPLEPPD